MADLAFNISKGRATAFFDRVDSNDPANSVLVLMAVKTVEADATLVDRADFAAILANGTVEATNANYARKIIDDAALATPAVDNANDRFGLTIPIQTWGSPAVAAAGGAWVALILGYDSDSTSGTDSSIIPIAKYDFAITPDGSIDIIANVSGDIYRTT